MIRESLINHQINFIFLMLTKRKRHNHIEYRSLPLKRRLITEAKKGLKIAGCLILASVIAFVIIDLSSSQYIFHEIQQLIMWMKKDRVAVFLWFCHLLPTALIYASFDCKLFFYRAPFLFLPVVLCLAVHLDYGGD